LKNSPSDPVVFKYRQGDFDAIPGSPWVYRITPSLRNLFLSMEKIDSFGVFKHGLSTCNNFRFSRFWYEIGIMNISFDTISVEQTKKEHKQWFPFLKGGAFLRWYGNNDYYNVSIKYLH
jgi:hypothetical protein